MDGMTFPRVPSGRSQDEVMRAVRAAGQRRRWRNRALGALPVMTLLAVVAVAASTGGAGSTPTRVVTPSEEQHDGAASTTTTTQAAAGLPDATTTTTGRPPVTQAPVAPQPPPTTTTTTAGPPPACTKADMAVWVVVNKSAYARGEQVDAVAYAKNGSSRRCVSRSVSRYTVRNEAGETVYDVRIDVALGGPSSALEPNQTSEHPIQWGQCGGGGCEQVPPGSYTLHVAWGADNDWSAASPPFTVR